MRILQHREPIEYVDAGAIPYLARLDRRSRSEGGSNQLRSVPPVSTYPKTDPRPFQTSSPSSRLTRSRSQLPNSHLPPRAQ